MITRGASYAMCSCITLRSRMENYCLPFKAPLQLETVRHSMHIASTDSYADQPTQMPEHLIPEYVCVVLVAVCKLIVILDNLQLANCVEITRTAA